MNYKKSTHWLDVHERSVLLSLADQLTWERGRQESGYYKADILSVASGRWAVERAVADLGDPVDYDAWMLWYPPGSSIPEHTDPAESEMNHVRLNAIISRGRGGDLTLDGQRVLLADGDAIIFRPDITRHAVSTVKSARYVLSVGTNLSHFHLGLVRLGK